MFDRDVEYYCLQKPAFTKQKLSYFKYLVEKKEIYLLLEIL